MTSGTENDPGDQPTHPGSDTEVAAMVARLSIRLQNTPGKPPAEGWRSVCDFFAERGAQLPSSLREEFFAMQTGLFAVTTDPSPRPLEPAEKLERLQQLIWQWRGARVKNKP